MIRFVKICSLFLMFSCNKNIENKIDSFKNENDSLRLVLNEMNNKYIFDSISIRDIPSSKNTYYNNSDIAGEIVIVAYNHGDKMNMILADSIVFESSLKLHNPDTLKMVKGGFYYRKKMKDSLSLNGIIRIENTYGKAYEALYKTLIKPERP